MNNYIPQTACVKRRVYILNSRNLKVGVYNGVDGFIGIRTKFDNVFLFTEYHWDTGPPYGTVRPLKDTGIDVPINIELKEYEKCGEDKVQPYRKLMKFLKKVGKNYDSKTDGIVI